MYDDTKPWWQSRTLWFNLLAAIGTALEVSGGYLQTIVGTEAYPMIALTLAVGNSVLRVITTMGLSK